MSKANDQLYEEAKEAIDRLFSDTSVSCEEAKENLRSLIGGIQIMLETLED